MKRSRLALMASASFLLLAAACDNSPKSADETPVPVGAVNQSNEWDQKMTAFLDGYFELNPDFAVYQGKHEFDGQLPDWSDAGLKKQAGYLRDALSKFETMDESGLSGADKFERKYAITMLKGERFWLEDADQPHRNPAYYFRHGLDPNVYIARPYADAETRMKAFIKYARAIPAAAAQIRANLKTPMPLSFINYAETGFNGFAEFYSGDARQAFAGVDDEVLQSELIAASEAAADAMKDLAGWMADERNSATQDFALGPERFASMLAATEMVNIPLDDLEAIGRADLKRNQEALREACSEFASGATIRECVAKMSSDKPADGPVAEARRQLPTLRAFLVDNDIVSIPGTETAEVEESPPYNRQNSAYIDIPGPFEKNLPSIYYISPPDPNWTQAVRDAYVPGKKDLLFTSVHEVWPGHFLNFLHANRSKSLFGRLFVGYAFAEGWAHYTEEMMWEAGLNDGDPETHIGQLSNALLRDCRFLSAIGMHARGMTMEQSKEMFLNECYQDEGNATQQAARGTYDPAYLNYTMGKLMIRKLREDWTADKGGRDAWKDFHDAFLSFGGPPIPMVRAAMMKEEAPQAVF